MDASVFDEFLQGEFGDVAAHEVVTGNDDGSRRVVDDDVDARGLFEGDDVAPFLTDDASLHVVRRKLHHGRGGFGGDFGCVTVDGFGEQVLAHGFHVFLGVLLELLHLAGEERREVAFEFGPELLLGFLGVEARDFLESFAVLQRRCLQFFLHLFVLFLLFLEACPLRFHFGHLLIEVLLLLFDAGDFALQFVRHFLGLELALCHDFFGHGLGLGFLRLDGAASFDDFDVHALELTFFLIDLRLERAADFLSRTEPEPASEQAEQQSREQCEEYDGVIHERRGGSKCKCHRALRSLCRS